MNPVWQSRVGTVVCVLGVVLFPWSLVAGAAEGQTGQQRSDKLLLEIMDMHTRVATDEVFLAQAQVVAAYLEAARQSDEAMKIEIYSRVQRLLSKIQIAAARDYLQSKDAKPQSDQASPLAQSDEGATTYKRGQALLEIFKGESLSQIPELPVIRTYWKQGLVCDGFPVPGREKEAGSHYIAKFTFWYEAIQAGTYGFTVMPESVSSSILRIGGVDVVKSSRRGQVEQGVCKLEKGFHRVEFWALGAASGPYAHLQFQVKILLPGALDAVPFTQDMMLLKKE